MAENGCGSVPDSLVAATYNIHGCVGHTDSYDPARVAAVIRELGADVVALQEVDNRRPPVGRSPQLDFLAQATALRPIAGPTIVERGGDYGNALLTRLDLLEARHHEIGVPGREPRGILGVDLWGSGGPLRILATHFGLKSWERGRQVRRLLELVSEDERPLVLMGDFNHWFPFGPLLSRLDATLSRSRWRRTFPAHRPLLPLDRIWVRPASALLEIRAHKTPQARRASDHLPLRAVIAPSLTAV